MPSLRDTDYDYAVFDLHDVLALAEHALTAAAPHEQALILLPGQPMTLTSANRTAPQPDAVPGYSPDTDRALNLPGPIRLLLPDPLDPLDSLLAKLYRGLAQGHHWLLLRDRRDDTCTSLETGTARSLPAHLQPAQPRHVPATVHIYDFGPFPANVIKGFTWNGFALPDFDLDTVRLIAEQLHQLNEHADDDQQTVIAIDDSGEVALVEHAGTGDEDRTVYAGTDGRYPIGSWSWCWDIDSTPTLPAMPPPDAQLWFAWRDVKAHTEHARGGYGHQPVEHPGGGVSTGPGLILTLAPGAASLRSNSPATALRPAPAAARQRHLHLGPAVPAVREGGPIEVLLPFDRHRELRPQQFDRCAGWLVVNVWSALPGMGGVPIALTYQSHCVPHIDTSAYTWRPAQLTCAQFPGRAYPGQIAAGVTTATGAVLARFTADTITVIAADTAASARTPAAVWATRSAGSVQLLTCLGDTAPDDLLQMGWAQQDPDGMYLLGAHQLDWRPAAG